MARILVIDDDKSIRKLLCLILENAGYEVCEASNGRIALEAQRESPADLIITDIFMPEMNGLDLAEEIRRTDNTLPVIVMTAFGTTETAIEATKMGAFDYVEKPVSYNQVVDSVAGALEYRASVSADQAILSSVKKSTPRIEPDRNLAPAPGLSLLEVSDVPQRTIRRSTVIYGVGLHSGGRTGMVLQPLAPGSGIHFVTLPTNGAWCHKFWTHCALS